MAAFTMVNEELLQSDPSLAPPLSTNWLEREKSATRWSGEPVLLIGRRTRQVFDAVVGLFDSARFASVVQASLPFSPMIAYLSVAVRHVD